MKIFFYSILLLLGFCKKVNSQVKYKALYQVQFSNRDKINLNEDDIKISDEIKNQNIRNLIKKSRKTFIRGILASESVYFNLDFNKIQSNFYLSKGFETKEEKYVKKMTKFRGEYFTINDQVFHVKDAFGENFQIKIPEFDWKITNETKKIGGYNCFKATAIKKINHVRGVTNRKIIAWFAPDLPFNFGPKEFSGLPGLVVNLQDGKLNYQLKTIEKRNDLKIEKPAGKKKVTLREFNEISKKMYRELKMR